MPARAESAPALIAGDGRRRADPQRRRRAPGGELERKLATGRPLRVKLGIDVTAPHVHVGHAIPLQRMAAFQRAGPRRRPHHRRLHDADRRPVGPLERAADPLRRGDRRERADLPRAGRRRSSTRARKARGALQRRVAREARLRRGRAPHAHDHGRAAARAGRLREALRGEDSDLGLRAPLPVHAGLRLGGDRGRRRARRARISSTTCSPAATSCRPTGSSRRSR